MSFEQNKVPWADVFCGRDTEVNVLKQAWEKVISGGKPQSVALVAESGLGKTRIVQEFYNWLSTNVDDPEEQGYWPDVLSRNWNNLQINPELSECLPTNSMRFLYWGFRLVDPQARNAVRSGILAELDILKAHLTPFAAAKLKQHRRKEIAVGAAADTAIEIGNLFTFGLLGIAKSLYTHGKSAIENEIIDSPKEQALIELHQIKQDQLIDIILSDIEQLMRTDDKRGERLPLVMAIDDAQWLANDEVSELFVRKFLGMACTNNWPVLLISTHWEMDWHTLRKNDPQSFPSICEMNTELNHQSIFLSKEPNLLEMVSAGLPGVDEIQRKMILDKADGNPRLMDEILRHLRAKPRYFEGRDVNAPLRGETIDKLARQQFDLHDLIFDRLSTGTREARIALGLSGLQGMQFLERLTIESFSSLSENGGQVGIEQAENPLAFIKRSLSGASEFTQRIYREVATEQLEDIFSLEETEIALRESLVVIGGEEFMFPDLDIEEREFVLRLSTDLFGKPGLSVEEHEKCAMAYEELLFLLRNKKGALTQGENRVALEYANKIIDHEFDLKSLRFYQIDHIFHFLESAPDNQPHAKLIALMDQFLARKLANEPEHMDAEFVEWIEFRIAILKLIHLPPQGDAFRSFLQSALAKFDSKSWQYQAEVLELIFQSNQKDGTHLSIIRENYKEIFDKIQKFDDRAKGFSFWEYWNVVCDCVLEYSVHLPVKECAEMIDCLEEEYHRLFKGESASEISKSLYRICSTSNTSFVGSRLENLKIMNRCGNLSEFAQLEIKRYELIVDFGLEIPNMGLVFSQYDEESLFVFSSDVYERVPERVAFCKELRLVLFFFKETICPSLQLDEKFLDIVAKSTNLCFVITNGSKAIEGADIPIDQMTQVELRNHLANL